MTEEIVTRNCLIEGCEREWIARHLCKKHYRQVTQEGRLAEFGKRFPPILTDTDFWQRAIITANPAKCWEWQRGFEAGGYGHAHIKGKQWKAHRYSWFLTAGYDSKVNICHRCDNPKCINPNHLFEGDHKANSQDMVNKGRVQRGEKHYLSNLSEQDVLTIRSMVGDGSTHQSVADQFNVVRETVSQIIQRKTWKHI